MPAEHLGADALVRVSISAMLEHQSENGAFVASPDFSQYSRYCWLRDGSFVAYALDRAGEHAAARRYHDWVDAAIGPGGIAAQIDAVVEKRKAGKAIVPGEMPPARFDLGGAAVDDDWPNFQIDGYGTWLWALGQHLALTDSPYLPSELRASAERATRYISAFALEPCFDVWEENGGHVHTSTLASVFAGLTSASILLGDDEASARAAAVAACLHDRAEEARYFPKSDGNDDIDASALWLAAPFRVVAADDPYLLATVEKIEAELVDRGGVRRFPGDTYFGGGMWPVLTCSLGWYYAGAGRRDEAERCRDWTRERFDDQGRLAEQFGGETRDPESYREWVERWGPPARDLLWSHAMYVVLCAEIEEYSQP
ncbi:MAG: hypothetical protein JWO62_3260 [Acidimicrobiaceae bacterium]|nr:hypothetical protein [Acidimicrobiaceae bacterium]